MADQLSLALPETGPEKKRRILTMMESKHPEFISECRRLVRHFIHSNSCGSKFYGVSRTVTADDIWEYLGTTRDITGHNRIMGSVFSHGGFVRVGSANSRQECHNSYEIKLWTLPEYADEARRQFRELEDLRQQGVKSVF